MKAKFGEFLNLDVVNIINPDNKSFIFGQSHFIKSVEDIHEAIVSSVPAVKFGLAFCEASGPCKIRVSGTSKDMENLAVKNAKAVGCGHTFFLFLDNAFPINVLPALSRVSEIVSIFCATANPLQVIVARTKQGGGVLGVVDGKSPQGIENSNEVKDRKKFLRNLGYKF